MILKIKCVVRHFICELTNDDILKEEQIIYECYLYLNKQVKRTCDGSLGILLNLKNLSLKNKVREEITVL